jgi:hypothetical protein
LSNRLANGLKASGIQRGDRFPVPGNGHQPCCGLQIRGHRHSVVHPFRHRCARIPAVQQ